MQIIITIIITIIIINIIITIITIIIITAIIITIIIIINNNNNNNNNNNKDYNYFRLITLSAGSDGSLSASGSASPGFDPRWGRGVTNFHLKIFNLGARKGGDVHFLIVRLYITVLD